MGRVGGGAVGQVCGGVGGGGGGRARGRVGGGGGSQDACGQANSCVRL